MKKLFTALYAAAAVVALSGCVAYSNGPYGRYHGHYGNYYDGYYDGYYGPYNSGYWASDGYFYYSDRQHIYHRDDSHHFRHERFNGGAPFHGDHRGYGDPSRDHAGDNDRPDHH